MKSFMTWFVFLFSAVHPHLATAQDAPTDNERVLSASIIEEVACAATTKSRVLCWMQPGAKQLYWTDGRLLNPPSDLKNPKEIVISNSAACVTTDLGIRCWGSDADKLQAKTSAWKRPRGLQLFLQEDWSAESKYIHHLCAITDRGVKCTNGAEKVLPTEMRDPDKILMLNNSPCVFQTGEIYCHQQPSPGRDWDAADFPEGLDDLRDAVFAKGGLNGCGISLSRGLVCWGNSKFIKYMKPQPGLPDLHDLKDAQKVVTASDEVCVLTASAGIQCWSESYRNANLVPDSFDIKDLFLSGTNKCVINGAGKMRCLGDAQGGYSFSLTVPKEIGY
jgi:hypothetical protein